MSWNCVNFRKLILLVFLFGFSFGIQAQKSGVNYETGISSNVSKENRLPFWLVSNRHGIVPNHSNGMLDFFVFTNPSQKKQKTIDFSCGAKIIGSVANKSDLLIEQAYGSFRWKDFQLDLGVKEEAIRFNGLSSTNGNILYSGNARPIPRIVLKLRDYVPLPIPKLKKWVAIKGLYSEGWLNDKRFAKNTRVHYKNAYVKLGGNSKFNAVLGFQHFAQWGGVSRDPELSKLAADFENYLRVIVAKGGTEDVTFSEFENSIGNHIGGWDFQLHYRGKKFTAQLYRQTIFEDHSGVYMHRPDGIIGLFVEFWGEKLWVTSFLYENYYTKFQSGSTPGGTPKPGGGIYTGRDNFFNNGIYRSGWTYFGHVIGSPFFVPAKVDDDGITLGVENNRFVAHHFGVNGFLFRKIPYRTLLSYTQNWGTYANPYPGGMQEQFSGYLELTLPKNQLPFEVNIAVAGDWGDLHKNNFGFYIRLAKKGIF